MSGRHRSDRLDRERARRARSVAEPDAAASRRDAARVCAWCGGPIDVKPVGRIPTWCSPACRQRAWEQKRAAESGLSAVRVVERVVAAPARASGPRSPRRGEWAALLDELVTQLDRGQLYGRDLPELTQSLDRVFTALRRASR